MMSRIKLLLVAALLMLTQGAYAETASIFDAIYTGNTAQVEKMLASGTDPNARFKKAGSPMDNITPLLLAVGVKQLPSVKLLLAKGADVNAAINADEKVTPLQLAVTMQEVATVEYLVAHGANVNAQNKHGDTALNLATFPYHPVDHPNTAITKILIANGADVNLGNIEGTVPINSIKHMEEEERANAEWLKKQEALAREEAEKKRVADGGKHRYGDNAYLCTNRSFTNICDETIEVTIKPNQICTGGTFRVLPGATISVSLDCKGLASWTAIYTGE